MQPRRFSVKYFAQGDIAIDLSALVPVFQKWIQQHSVEGMLVDVVDYKHVYQGPGVVLIGHEADYSFDLRGGHPGLVYTRKRAHQHTLSDDLQLAIRLAADASRKLEKETPLNGIRFDYNEVKIVFLDRLNTPNTPEVFESIRGELHGIAAALYQTEAAQVESIESDPRQCLTIRIAASQENVAG